MANPFLRMSAILCLALLCAPAAVSFRVQARDGQGSSSDDVAAAAALTQQKLVTPDGSASDAVGHAVAISGTTAVLGAPLADIGGNADQGAVYVQALENGVWSQQAKLVASDGNAESQFGYAVAIDGDTIVVGARRTNDDEGAAYVFARSGANWTQQVKLIGNDSIEEDDFGASVAISGNTIVVGAPRHDTAGTLNTNKGAAYIFTRTGVVWTQQAKLTAAQPKNFDFLGASVAIDGDTVVIGAPDGSNIGNFNPGSAVVFIRSGNNWSQQAKLLASDGAHNNYFGGSVSISGDTAVIGAIGVDIDGILNQGAAYVFTRSGQDWFQQAKLTGNDAATGSLFGTSVSINGDRMTVGARGAAVDGKTSQGGGYFFRRTGDNWTLQAKLIASDGVANDFFGNSIGVGGNFIIAGTPQKLVSFYNSVDTPKRGAGYLFSIPPNDGVPQILGAGVAGKKLIVMGANFESPCEIYLNGEKQKKTSNDEQDPTTTVIARKSGKLIAPGQTVVVQVRNSASGKLSNEFLFTRSLQQK